MFSPECQKSSSMFSPNMEFFRSPYCHLEKWPSMLVRSVWVLCSTVCRFVAQTVWDLLHSVYWKYCWLCDFHVVSHFKKEWLRKYSLLKSLSDFLDTQFFFFSWMLLWLNYMNLQVDLSYIVGVLHYGTEWQLKWRKKQHVFVSSQTYRNAQKIPQLLFIVINFLQVTDWKDASSFYFIHFSLLYVTALSFVT